MRGLSLAGSLVLAVSPTCVQAQNAQAVRTVQDALEAIEDFQTPDPAKLSEARAIIAVMFPPAERDQTIRAMMAGLMDQFIVASPVSDLGDPGLNAILQDYLKELPARLMPTMSKHMPRITDATAVAYTHEFSLEELKTLHAFALTDTGRHYFSRSTTLVNDPAVAAANTALMTEIQGLRGEIEKEVAIKVIPYLMEHPEIVERIEEKQKAARPQ